MEKEFMIDPANDGGLVEKKSKDCRPVKVPRAVKSKKSDSELVQEFWNAPMEAFFGQETVGPVTNKSIKTLECDRWRGAGVPFRKCSGRVLYRKADVVAWLESHKLVFSTSEYEQEVGHG
jgi:hypothetical protein